MEVFPVNHQFPDHNDTVEFPLHLTPFPDAAAILYSNPTAEIPPPEMQYKSHPPPPQKLRPIRSNGRTSPEYIDRTVDLEGAVHGCYSELGFPNQLSLAEVYGGSSVDVAAAAAERMKVEMEAACAKLISEGELFETELSSSSDDDGDSSEAVKEPLNRKRKRKTRKKIELYLKNMMTKVLQKQEQMHNQLIEMIEKKERERIIREEAWKQQEIERAKKGEEVRAEERSRTLVLISFIQNLLGHEIQIPKSWETSCLEKGEVEIHNQKDLSCDPCNRRWPKSEVQALITVRTALDHKFLKGVKGIVWEEVAAGLSNMGYSRSAKKCKEKWENINKYYKRTMETGKKRPDGGKSCPYFNELDILYTSGLVNPGNASHCIKNEIEDRSVEE
ncbi:hypothetical protein RHMOL_Rhmol02G0100500 [Rhododendron molle]|uniref:Uncharacterized protein n=1 Tax=Rhododendron molle TaxID=49168 RepID=A0ACC0PQ79_RHOML|nr:hypothetical protein RHMOL_Rhmol02G0100500 [Rhododendron molle]